MNLLLILCVVVALGTLVRLAFILRARNLSSTQPTTVPGNGPFRTAPPRSNEDDLPSNEGPTPKLILDFVGTNTREVVCPACNDNWKWWYLPSICACSECEGPHFHQKHAYVDTKDGKGVRFGKVPTNDQERQGCGFEWIVRAKHVSPAVKGS